MDLTGQLSNLHVPLVRLLALPLARDTDRAHQTSTRPALTVQRRAYEIVRRAILEELASEESGLRLMEIRRRVENRLGESVDSARFRDYVNYQSRSANPWLERLGYGRYSLRS